jgi:hypothetical protein
MSPEEVKRNVKVGDIVILNAKFSGIERKKSDSIVTVKSIGEITELTDKYITITSEKRWDVYGKEIFGSLHHFYFEHWDIEEISIIGVVKFNVS